MHFGYKSCVSFTNIHLSVTNIAFGFTKWLLALLLSLCRQIISYNLHSVNYILHKLYYNRIKKQLQRGFLVWGSEGLNSLLALFF